MEYVVRTSVEFWIENPGHKWGRLFVFDKTMLCEPDKIRDGERIWFVQGGQHVFVDPVHGGRELHPVEGWRQLPRNDPENPKGTGLVAPPLMPDPFSSTRQERDDWWDKFRAEREKKITRAVATGQVVKVDVRDRLDGIRVAQRPKVMALYQVSGWSVNRLADWLRVDYRAVARFLESSFQQIGLQERPPKRGGRPRTRHQKPGT
jgi:hypothetical protein